MGKASEGKKGTKKGRGHIGNTREEVQHRKDVRKDGHARVGKQRIDRGKKEKTGHVKEEKQRR